MLAGLAPGTVVSGYRVESRIGAGGMAVVYRARDESLGRLVALKVLAPTLAGDQEFRERFIRESRAAAAVDHPHIIPVYSAGEADGVLYLAMRYVSGGDLRSVSNREGPLSGERAALLLSPIASALDAAHAAGLVHRDVKLANILVDTSPGRPDHPYLSDFGLAKGSAAATGLTGTGQFLGTPDYSSPEQIAGRTVDARTDQYALACVTYTMLTGQLPFARGSAMSVLWAHMNEPPPPVTARRPDLPAAVDRVLARGLAKTPGERFATCGDFAEELRGALGAGSYAFPARGSSGSLPSGLGDRTSSVPPSLPSPARPASPSRPAAPARPLSPAQPHSPARPASAAGPASFRIAPASRPAAAGAGDPSRGPWERDGAPSDPAPPWSSAPPPADRRPSWEPALAAQDGGAQWFAAAGSPPARGQAGTMTAGSFAPAGPTMPADHSGPRWAPTEPNAAVAAGRGGPPPAQGRGRRRTWLYVGVGVLAAAGAAAGALIAVPRTPAPVLRPTGLAAVYETTGAVDFSWKSPATGPLPDSYEIFENGAEIGSVPGNVTTYRASGLAPASQYDFAVLAVRGGTRSPASAGLAAQTQTPPLSAAVLGWSGSVTYDMLSLSSAAPNWDHQPGDSWQDSWSFSPACSSGPCDVKLAGNYDNNPFTMTLKRSGATYTGSGPLSNAFNCSGAPLTATLSITITVSAADVQAKTWAATAFSGDATLVVPPSACLGDTADLTIKSD